MEFLNSSTICSSLGIFKTATAAWVDALGDSGVRVRDTRKTVPGRVRAAEVCGGDAAAASTTGWDWEMRPSSKTITWPLRVDYRGSRGGPHSCPRRDLRGRRTPSTRCARQWRRAPSWCCSTTCLPTR